MKISPLQIQDLETMQDLSNEEISPVQGGLSILKPDEKLDVEMPNQLIDPKGRIAYPFPRPYPLPLPHPCPPWPPRPICTNFPTKDGHLPWCAVIL